MKTMCIIKIIVIALLSVSLTGCFKSDVALISAGDADYPFEIITYVRVDDDDKITLKRVGDRYVNIAEKDKAFVRMKALGDHMFVAQITELKDGKPFHLYGVIRLAPDRTGFELIKGVAKPNDLTAVRDGKVGLSICPEDDDMVCIGTLKGFVDYAVTAIRTAHVEHFKILALE